MPLCTSCNPSEGQQPNHDQCYCLWYGFDEHGDQDFKEIHTCSCSCNKAKRGRFVKQLRLETGWTHPDDPDQNRSAASS